MVNEYTWPRPFPWWGTRRRRPGGRRGPTPGHSTRRRSRRCTRSSAARRDIRRYRPDPVPAEVLRAVLAAGHQAPSVGHSQPWRFIVVTEQATRDRAALLADRERLRQADQLTQDRRARLLDLQLDGIREAPVGVVVACDRRTPAAGVLGRATFADADLWSCACAVQNMWLAARAAGLGPRLGDAVRPPAWPGCCTSRTASRPSAGCALAGPTSGHQTPAWNGAAGPSASPLDEVILSERWPSLAAPESPQSHLAVLPPAPATPTLAGPDQRAVVAGRDSGDDLLAVPGSLGVLDATVNRVLALSAAAPVTGTLVIAAADHPVTRYGVSAYPPHVTADVYEATVKGVSLGATTARHAGLACEAVYARPAGPQGDLAASDALTEADVDALVAQGIDLGERTARGGLICLGEAGIGNTTVAAALACALLDLDPARRWAGAASDTAMMARKRDVIGRALDRARSEYGEGIAQAPWLAAAALGGPEIALLAGVTLGAARCGVPVVLDGLVTSVAALLAVRAEPAVQAALVAGAAQPGARSSGRPDRAWPGAAAGPAAALPGRASARAWRPSSCSPRCARARTPPGSPTRPRSSRASPGAARGTACRQSAAVPPPRATASASRAGSPGRTCSPSRSGCHAAPRSRCPRR